MNSPTPKFVVIGGGTGSFTLLSGLKNYVQDLTALVNMADDGGSTGILRDELGVLPPGDIRQCLVALSESSQVRDLFSYRFDSGSLKGHSFGNLFLSAVEKMTDSFSEAVDLAGSVLRIQGRVLPVTVDKAKLVMVDSNGKKTEGEFNIGSLDFEGNEKPDMHLEPNATITNEAAEAILAADLVVIAPGNLYGSLAPAPVVDGVKSALDQTSAKIVYVCNLVTKPHQTDHFTVLDYAAEIERFIGSPVLDYVIFNTDEPTPSMMRLYTHEGEFPVEFDLEELHKQHYKPIGMPLIDISPIKQSSEDRIAQSRSLIRHDSDKVARQLMRLYFE